MALHAFWHEERWWRWWLTSKFTIWKNYLLDSQRENILLQKTFIPSHRYFLVFDPGPPTLQKLYLFPSYILLKTLALNPAPQPPWNFQWPSMDISWKVPIDIFSSWWAYVLQYNVLHHCTSLYVTVTVQCFVLHTGYLSHKILITNNLMGLAVFIYSQSCLKVSISFSRPNKPFWFAERKVFSWPVGKVIYQIHLPVAYFV